MHGASSGSSNWESGLQAMMQRFLQDDEFTRAYLTARWIEHATLQLRHARRKAQLSQAEIAARMNTKQPSIARLEGDHSGSVTLRRYAEFLAACGVVPFDVEVAEAELVRQFLMDDPSASVVATTFGEWLETLEDEPMPDEASAPVESAAPRNAPALDLNVSLMRLVEQDLGPDDDDATPAPAWEDQMSGISNRGASLAFFNFSGAA